MKSKVKLLVGITHFSKKGGAERLFLDEINHFNKDKYEIAILTFFEVPKGDDFFDLLPPEVKIYRLNFKNFRDIKNWLKACKIIKDFKPDVVLSTLFFSNTVLRTLKIFFHYKILIYEQNTYTKKTKLQILADKILSYFTYKIIASSDTVKNFTAGQEKINKDKFVVILSGINLSRVSQELEGCDRRALKQKLGFGQEDKLIINVARLYRQKNHKLLIDSFNEFIKRNSGYKLIILGDGPEFDFLSGYVKELNLEGKVLLLGHKTNVFEYMFISEFFVLTSKIEGFALVCIEAMAVGLPVVSTNVAGPDQYIINGFNGYLVKSEDPGEIAQNMQEIADRGPDYFSENCKVTAQKYDIKENVKKLEAIL